jgi:hypothetical protein
MLAHGDGYKRMWFTELGIRDRWEVVQAISVYNLRNKGTYAGAI